MTYFKFRGWVLASYILTLIILVRTLKPELNIMGLWGVLLGLNLRLAASLYIHDKTNYNIYQADNLSEGGFYQLSRNPLYLSNMISSVSILWFANLPGLFINGLLFIAVWVHHEILIRGEEKFLKQKFSAQFIRYQEKVPRWFNFKAFSTKINGKPSSPFKKALRVQFPNLLKTAIIPFILVGARYA